MLSVLRRLEHISVNTYSLCIAAGFALCTLSSYHTFETNEGLPTPPPPVAAPEHLAQTHAEPMQTFLGGWQHGYVEKGQTPAGLLNQLGLENQRLTDVLHLPAIKNGLSQLALHQSYHVLRDEQHRLYQLVFHAGVADTIHLKRLSNDRFVAHIHHPKLTPRLRVTTAVIHDSLFLDGKRAGLSQNVIMNVMNIFGGEIDFARSIKPGDKLSVIYKTLYDGNRLVKTGDIAAAEFISNGKTLRAVAFQDPNGRRSYYTPEGMSLKRAFLKTPLKYRHISSRFSHARLHPIFHRLKRHQGVDYAAAAGTPIWTVGSGRVEFIGRKNGYGNAIIISHNHKYQTLYAHMSHFAKNLRPGSRVEQGQVIGYVGKTGWATAPHLHFEFHIQGKHFDPLNLKLPYSESLSKQHLHRFLPFSKKLMHALDRQKSTMMAQSENHISTESDVFG